MDFLVGLILTVIFFVVAGLLSKHGMWSNALLFVNVTVAALLATNLWEPVAKKLSEAAPDWSSYTDIFCLWVLFAVFLMLLRTLTDYLSMSKVRFHKLVAMIGAWVFAALTSWVLVCFMAMSMHMAPLGREYLFGSFKAEQPLMFGTLSPDRMWLGFVQGVSLGGFARSGDGGKPDEYVFDPQGDFMLRYAARRQAFDEQQAKAEAAAK